MPESIFLSICIATRNRGDFLNETLELFAKQMMAGVEVVVVDGASTDNTPQILANLANRYSWLRYYRPINNGGIDTDYDLCVRYAHGVYCWMYSDDDWPLDGVLQRILTACQGGHDLIFIDAQVRNKDMSKVILPSRALLSQDEDIDGTEIDKIFVKTAKPLTFIGSCVLKRARWLNVNHSEFNGFMFPHIAPLFDFPMENGARLLHQPGIAIRYGNASWTAHSYQIWMFKWPQLVWKLRAVSDAAKAQVSKYEPWRDWRNLLWQRAKGVYGLDEYRGLLKFNLTFWQRIKFRVIAITPGDVAIAIGLLGSHLRPKSKMFLQFELKMSKFYRPVIWDRFMAK